MVKLIPGSLTVLLATAGSIVSFLPTYAVAQQADVAEQAETSSEDETKDAEKTENKLIVTGSYTGSLIRSLEEKRNADTVSEQISADDIGALPDVSIADALTRLPGISAIRTGGQAAEINIRGLSGIFIHSTLNGREQVSTSGTRSVEFDQYPSELIASGSVYKSQKASLIEGGVAGSIELRTASPFNNAEQHKFNANLRLMHNDRASSVYDADEWGERLSFSYQGKFAQDTLGVSLGFARLNQPSVAEQFIGLTYPTLIDLDNRANDTDLDNADCPNCELVSEGMELQHKGGTETRNGYMAALEWAPTDDFVLKADAFVSRFDSQQWARGLRVKFGGSTANYYFSDIVENTMVGGVVARTSNSGTRVEIANDDDTEQDNTESFGLRGEWQLTDAFQLKADLSHSKGESDFQNRLLWSLVAEDATVANPVLDTNVVINYQFSGLDIPSVGFNQDFSDPGTLMPTKYGTYPFLYKDRVNAFRMDSLYELFNNDYLSSIEFGVRYSERRYDATRKVYEYGNDSDFASLEPPFQLQPGMAQVVNWSGDFSHFPSYLAINIDQVLDAWLPTGEGTPLTTFGTNALGEIDYHTDWSVRQSGSVFEDVTAAYLMANIDTYLADFPVTGNLGVRAVNSDQSATRLRYVDETLPLEQRLALGAQYITDEAGLVSLRYARDTDGINYTDYLPSLNLNVKLTDDSQLRFAAARVMARPEINRLAADFSGQVIDNPNQSPQSPEPRVFTATQTNNPRLKPFLADQYDLSFEHYYPDGTGGYSIAVFYKNIKNFVDRITIPNFDFDAAGIPNPETYLDPVSLVEDAVGHGDFTIAFNNDKGGSIHGFELATTTVFDQLPGIWSGLGVNASYAYTDSEVKTLTETGQIKGEISFEGLSQHVANATVFFNYDQFETRISTRYRSEFVSRQWGVNEQVVYFDDETVMDFQASYDVNESTRLLFQINNLTDQPTKSYFVSEARTGTIQFFGRQIFLGANVSL